jgi:hypothetical protein
MEKMPLRNGGIYSKSEYVGKSLTDAREYAEIGGYSIRIVEENGRSHMITADLDDRRMNFRISNDKVTDAFVG